MEQRYELINDDIEYLITREDIIDYVYNDRFKK